MSTPKAIATHAELRRALRAMRDAGFDEGRVEVTRPDGTRVAIAVGRAAGGVDDTDDIDGMIDKVQNP